MPHSETNSIPSAQPRSDRSIQNVFHSALLKQPLDPIAVPFICFAVIVYNVFAYTVDDPFITFRYAANIRLGYGPVFNPGEHVEGYSSPLHLLLCVLLGQIFPSVGMLFKAKLLGIVFGVLTLFQTRVAASRLGLGPKTSLLAVTLVAINSNFAMAAVNGLETTVYCYLLLVTFTAFVMECKSGKGRSSAFGAFLCVMARPDAMLIVALLTLSRVLYGRVARYPSQFVLTWLGTLALPILLFMAFRLSYYGLPFPNTYYAKLTLLSASYEPALYYLGHPLTTTFPHEGGTKKYLLAFYGPSLLGWWFTRRRGEWILGFSIVLCAVCFVFKAGGDWMVGWRFMVPVLPLFALAQALAACEISRAFTRRFGNSLRSPSWITNATIVLILIASPLAGVRRSAVYPWSSVENSTSDRALISSTELSPTWISAADYVRAHTAPGQTVAFSEMGYTPYLNMDRIFIDTVGLCDKEIAQFPIRFKGRTGVGDWNWTQPGDPLYQYLKRKQPDLIMGLDFALPRKQSRIDVPGSLMGTYIRVPTTVPHTVTYIKRLH